MQRRTFLKQAAISGALAGSSVAKPADLAYPRVFTGRQLQMLAFPLGGVGAGSISLGGRGQLRDWEIFNRPEKGKSPAYAFPSIWVRNGGEPVARVLEARIQPPYEGPSGLGSNNVPGLPRLKSCTFTGEFPVAQIAFQDARLPVRVSLDAFTPFIPLEADDSGLPVAILRYRVSNTGTKTATVSIAYSIDNPVGTQGRTNQFRKSERVQGLFMQNPFLAKTDPFAGSFALTALDTSGAHVTYVTGWEGGGRWKVGPLSFWDDFSSDGDLGPDVPLRDNVGSLCIKRDVAPRTEAQYTFLLSWHFPNRTSERCSWTAPKGHERDVIGNHYCTRFRDAWDAAEYTAARLPELEKRTRRFVAAIRATTIPAEVREGAMANLSTLVTPTSFRTADGHFHGFEGCNNSGGCCFGNCTHVWNYEVATSFLFPSHSRSLRESSFGYCTDERGKMDIRELLPGGIEHFGYAAADGQMGQIMKLYLDWRLSGDADWLRTHWPAAKRALEFAWIPGGWDANRDGVMEGVQHNTYDVEFLGPNPLCGVWYLGALRAAEQMATAMNDPEFAGQCRQLFESGSKWIDANLFNGEYYIQKIQGTPKDRIAPGLISGMGSADTESPDFQVGEGCLVDQLLGQYFAHMVGLGPLLDPAHIRTAVQSIYKNNYKRSMYDWESVQRTYVLNDEAALVVCDYPAGKRPKVPFPYFAEVFTGLEYATAALMMAEGMVDKGVEAVRSVRRRYDGERRNAWNEAECGNHYARAMSSWAPIVILSGFDYDAPSRAVTAKPRINAKDFKSFWSTASGWGTFSHTERPGSTKFAMSLDHGAFQVSSVALARQGKQVPSVSARLNGKEIRGVKYKTDTARFASEVTLREGDTLEVNLE